MKRISERLDDFTQFLTGVGAYGKTYEIFSRVEHNFYDLAKGPGVKSEITDAPGTSAMFEVESQR